MGAAPCHGTAKPMSVGLALQNPQARCLSFPVPKEQGTQPTLLHKHVMLVHLAPASVPEDPTACPHPLGKEFVGFVSLAKLRTAQRIWFRSPHCKKRILLFQHPPVNSFWASALSHVDAVNPAIANHRKCTRDQPL